jgi:DNA-binding NarL/FixJ family response regulator
MTKIMIVEDNIRARHALKALISLQVGIDVTAEASNGREAIQAIKGQIPDIILMDMRMPVMDGLETTKVIKAQWNQIKIVILTMYPDCQSDVLSAGADAFLLKGCPMEQIIGSIRELLKSK